MDNQIAIVLGGTYPHISLLKKLKERGYFTVLVDYFENPPAKAYADEHIQASTLDKEAVLNISKDKRANLVISAYVDQANVTSCYVSEKLGLPHPYSYQTSLNVTNKLLMKDIMVRNSIPTSKHIILNDISQCDEIDLLFPVIVKPSDSNSSKGVRKATNKVELKEFAEKAFEISRNKKIIVEEYKIGKEIGIDCYIKNGKATILMTKERVKIPTKISQNEQIIGCIWPINLDDKDINKYIVIAESIAEAFHLKNTPLMIQAIENNDEISVIEFGARFGGGESFRIIELSTGFDTTSAVIDSYLGNNVDVFLSKSEYYYADTFLYSEAGYFSEIRWHEDLINKKTVEYINAYKTYGSSITNEISSNNRVGVFVVKSKTKYGLREKISQVVRKINVYDTNNNQLLKKYLYEF